MRLQFWLNYGDGGGGGELFRSFDVVLSILMHCITETWNSTVELINRVTVIESTMYIALCSFQHFAYKTHHIDEFLLEYEKDDDYNVLWITIMVIY